MPNTTQLSPAVARVNTLAPLTILIALLPIVSAYAQQPPSEAPSRPPAPPTVTLQAPKASAGLTPAQSLAKSKGMRAVKLEDFSTAIDLLRPIAETGDPESQNAVGEILSEGKKGVAIDTIEAAAWFRKAAIQGYGAGQVNLGLMLENGLGVIRDEAEAARWYRRAALEGFAEGQHNLARVYAAGKGLPLDINQAVFWYNKAVNQNFAPSQFNYGLMHRDGVGVTRNPAEAIRLFRRAASQGMTEAREALEEMEAQTSTSSRSDQ